MVRYVEPSVHETAFNCPHCGALANQSWFDLHGKARPKGGKPNIWSREDAEGAVPPENIDIKTAEEIRDNWWRMASGEVYLYGEAGSLYASWLVNLNISCCFNCDGFAVWRYDRMVWPLSSNEYLPAADMPTDVKNEFEEAAQIVEKSPRGAAALLRLAIQRLCVHLGESGSNINDDIKQLVKKGLDVRVQRALDVVRVVGNNAVHPGEIDLSDDRETAVQLFSLVNLIVEIMITQPAHIARMYDALPEGALAAIDRRDSAT